MAEIKHIRSVKDYETALDRISELMGAAYGSPEGLELDILADYLVEYEGAHVPMIPYRSQEADSGIDPGELAERYPRLFHMAATGSWPSIERHGLLSASALLDVFGVSEERRVALETRHRPTSVPICRPGLGRAVVRDQKPMSDKALCKCLRDGLKPCDWYRTLNSKVFFWLTRERLERMLKACRDTPQIVLIVDTESLIAAYSDRVTLSPIHNGSTLFNPAPRGRNTFLPLDRYPFRDRLKKRNPRDAIAELAVEGGVPNIRDHVLLVRERQAGAPPKSIWRRESGAVSPCAGQS